MVDRGNSAIVQASPPKAHLPGNDVPNPQSGEGGCPFEPGRVRETHGTAGAVGVSAPLAPPSRRERVVALLQDLAARSS